MVCDVMPYLTCPVDCACVWECDWVCVSMLAGAKGKCIARYTATHCNTLLHIRVCCVVPRQSASLDTLQHTATCCNTLQHAATLKGLLCGAEAKCIARYTATH